MRTRSGCTERRSRRVGRNGAQVERLLRNLGVVEGYRPGPEHYGDDKVLPGLPWGRVLHQGKPGKSLTASQCYYKSAHGEDPRA